MKYIEKSWEKYKEQVVPERATNEQLRQLKLAFFAGSIVLFSKLIGSVGPGQGEPTREEIQILRDIDAEIQEFVTEGAREMWNRKNAN